MIGCPVVERLAEMRIALDIDVVADGGCAKLASWSTTLPGPGPLGLAGPNGNGVFRVVGARGSFHSRRSLNTDSAFAAPSRVSSAARNSERRASSPPPAPNRAPSRHVHAITLL